MISLSNGPDMLANELRKQRVIRGYSQEYMAECLGISQRQYNRMGNARFSMERWCRLCKILEISQTDFFTPPRNSLILHNDYI